MNISDFMEAPTPSRYDGPEGIFEGYEGPDPFEDTGTENLSRAAAEWEDLRESLKRGTRVHSRIAQPIALPSRAVLASLINEALELWILDATNLGDNNAGVSIADYIIKELS
jgi:hypothetical protein